LSHLSLIRHLAKSDFQRRPDQWALILEVDANIVASDADFKNLMEPLGANRKLDWPAKFPRPDLIYVGHCFSRLGPSVTKWLAFGHGYCTHGFAISPVGARKIAMLLEGTEEDSAVLGRNQPVDNMLREICSRDGNFTALRDRNLQFWCFAALAPKGSELSNMQDRVNLRRQMSDVPTRGFIMQSNEGTGASVLGKGGG
jgi:hypothetical protein